MLLTTPHTDVPRRMYYGWPMLIGLSVSETISWGVLYYAFPVFIRPMESELGWSRAQVTGAFSLALLVAGLAAIPIGHWLDARGPRALMTGGSLLAAALLLAWSRVETLAWFYVIWAGLGAAMAAVLYEPAFAIVTTWFVRDRHRALTVLTVFGGVASTVFVPLSSWLLDRNGWRGAVATLAVLLAATTVPLHGLLLRRHPHDVGSEADGDAIRVAVVADAAVGPSGLRGALESREFLGLAAAFALSSAATVGAAVHLIPYLVEREVPAATAAASVGLIGLMQLPGRALYGPLRRRLTTERALMWVFLVQSAAVFSLPWIGGQIELVAFAVAFGMANGMATLLRASTIGELFGRGHYGRISGVLSFLTTCARAVGPIAVALIYGSLGSYRPAFCVMAVLLAAAAASALMTRGDKFFLAPRDPPGLTSAPS